MHLPCAYGTPYKPLQCLSVSIFPVLIHLTIMCPHPYLPFILTMMPPFNLTLTLAFTLVIINLLLIVIVTLPHPCLHPCIALAIIFPSSSLSPSSSLHCSCHHLSVIITLTFIFVLFVAIIISLLSSLPCHLFCPHHSHLYFCLGCCCHYLITGITAAPSCLHPHCPCPCVLLTSPCLSPRDQHGTSNPPWSWVGIQVQVGL